MASLAYYGLCDPASYAAPVMGKSQFCLGLSTFPSFHYQSLGPVWVELHHPYHAVSWAGPDLLFIQSCVILLQLPILLHRSSPFHLSYQSICSETQS